MERNLVFISGYYGFDNLGDEAILEQLISELKQKVAAENIVVLSADPQKTAARYGVRSMQRKDFGPLWSELIKAKLFISGGGGLFQNTRSLGSIIFYGLQILMAKANQVPIAIYAQGIGPLNGPLAQNLTRQVFQQADSISVRDDASIEILKSWSLTGVRTSDPVWNLEAQEPPEAVLQQLDKNTLRVGLSLRPSPDLTDEHLKNLADGLSSIMAVDEQLVLLAFQKEQDEPVLRKFAQLWTDRGRQSILLDTSSMQLPSQWAGLFSRFRFVVAMRLHALILALKAGLPVSGVAYDPKVMQLLAEFEQSCLILTKESGGSSWIEELKTFKNGLSGASKRGKEKLDSAKKLACQNFDLLARILDMPRDGRS